MANDQLHKRLLVAAGSRAPEQFLSYASALLDYLTVGKYMANHSPKRFRDRNAVYDYLATSFFNKRVLYLEFGVADGAALSHWVSLLKSPETQFHGFDSFEGLPADWSVRYSAGTFGQGGRPPDITDQRVHFHVGWFRDTFPKFRWPSGTFQLIANFDADLYESTAEALEFVEPHVHAGTIFCFDEFNHRADELRAFDQYVKRTDAQARALAATFDLARVAFRIT